MLSIWWVLLSGRIRSMTAQIDMPQNLLVSDAVLPDLDSWMNLVSLVRSDFPGLETEELLAEHRKTVERFIRRGEAICARMEHVIVGTLLYSTSKGMLCFLAVHPDFRGRGIASAMIDLMLKRMPTQRTITVSTYREGDPKGEAARALYKKVGFEEGDLGVEFGYPQQTFTLRRN